MTDPVQGMGAISSVVFDLDGVLIDSTPCHRDAFREVLSDFGIADFDYSEYAGRRTNEVMAEVLGPLGHGAGVINQAAIEKSRLARERLAASNPVAPGCVTVLKSLARRYVLALASSGSRESVELFLRANHLEHLFRLVVCGEDVSSAKPSPEIYEKTFAGLGLRPAQCAVVEDAVAGVQAAVAAGAGLIAGVAGTYTREALLDAGANWVVDDLSGLPARLDVSTE